MTRLCLSLGLTVLLVIAGGTGVASAAGPQALCFPPDALASDPNDLAKAKNKIAKIAIRINPNVDAHTHHFITTGLDENKFGINIWQLPDVVEALRARQQAAQETGKLAEGFGLPAGIGLPGMTQ